MKRLLFVIIFSVLSLQGQYLISDPDSLLDSGADYLVVTHQDFTNELYPLCQLRRL
jgi:hypothetical protein